MNVERQNKWMILRFTSSPQWCVSLALLCATTSPSPSFSQGTPEQRLACTPDVLRLCSAFIPNADEITICLREKNAELSDATSTLGGCTLRKPYRRRAVTRATSSPA